MKACLFLSLIWLIGCSLDEKKENVPAFEKYLQSLPTIHTPLRITTQNDLKGVPSFDTTGFEKFKHIWTDRPLGKLFEKDSVVMTVEVTIADLLVPTFMTYDRAGHKLDSLHGFQKSGWDLGYETNESIFINDQKQIMIIDSTTTWEVNANRTDIINGTNKLTVDTTLYRITNRGKFIQIRR